MDDLSHWHYNAEDCVRTFEVFEQQARSLGILHPQWPRLAEVENFQQRLAGAALRAMEKGIRIDPDARIRLNKELKEEIDKRNRQLTEVIGHSLNKASSVQMKRFFYEELQQKPVWNPKTKTYTLNEDALLTIAQREPLLHPLCKWLIELGSLNVFLNTFVRAKLDIDGRMRCSFNPCGTITYRFAARKNVFRTGTNLENVPKGDEDEERDHTNLTLPNVRKLFVPDPGCEFFDIDLRSADLHVVAWDSGDPLAMEILEKGGCIYLEAAREYYHNPSIGKGSRERQVFKKVIHGTNYLGSPVGIAKNAGLLQHEVGKIQKWYFGRHPRILNWQERIKRQVRENHFVENVFGHRIWFTDRIDDRIFRQAVAAIPQSTVACLINRGWVALHEETPEVEVLLQVHDSLAGQIPLGRPDLQEAIKQKCSIELPFEKPLTIPVGIKTSPISWGCCE